ncbi:porin family protein [Gallalistipes aquisgranensis]|uniref:porin family protein n=1 Tax=Gallalistipes aquisgranensis TaxID=2779358 RepID=UPI001CF86070|nr:porin family protein [Gallalistipes aquisgranensis]MBE5032559.1 PorT family protein [Gallalistipes aquisgranensis]
MKKLVLLVACAFVAAGAFAQPKLGIKAGLNLADISNVEDSKMKPSFYAGAFVDFQISDFFTLSPELLYSRQGAYFKEGDLKRWERLNYLNIPVMCKFTVVKGLSVDVGPQFGFNLNGKAKMKYDDQEYKTSISDEFNTFDFGLNMGLSYMISEKFDVAARYNLGLTDVVKDNEGDACRNGVIQIGVGYRF